MECFWSVTAGSQSEPVSFDERSIEKQIQVWQGWRNSSSLFSQKLFWALGSLGKLYLFSNVFAQDEYGVVYGKVAPNYIIAAHNSAEPKVNSNELRKVT